MTYLIYILAFAVLLGVLVTIHEFGHFIVARMCNVYVQRFSIGMGPVFYKKYDKHGTEFALSAIPLGGYVSMITNKLIELEPDIKNQLSEDQLKMTFDSRPKWQRACIMFAGPLANFLLSIFIFTTIFLNTPDPQTLVVVNEVRKESINYSNQVFFKPGDQIIEINDVRVSDAKDISLELLTYAGYSGVLNFKVKRLNTNEFENISIYVSDFLPTSESQENPSDHIGIDLRYEMQPIIGNVIPGGAADKANIVANDLILKIDESNINFASDISSIVSLNPNKTMIFYVQRDGQNLSLYVDIGSVSKELENKGILGVSFGTSRTFMQSLSKGTYETYNLSLKTLQFIGKMLTGNMGTENLSGPIGIAQMAGNTAQAGFLPFMYLMALLSISLAVINLLPIPVLDGGQLTLLGIEAIRGKPLPEKAENFIYAGGTVLVGMLMIFAIFNDVARFL